MCLRDLASSRRQGQVRRLWPASSPGAASGGLCKPAPSRCAAMLPCGPWSRLFCCCSVIWIHTKLSAEMCSVSNCAAQPDQLVPLTLPFMRWLQAVSEAVEDVKSCLPHLAAGSALHLEPESIYALVPQNWLQVSPQVLPDGLGSKDSALLNTWSASDQLSVIVLPLAQACSLSVLFAFLRLHGCRAACCSLWQQAWEHS